MAGEKIPLLEETEVDFDSENKKTLKQSEVYWKDYLEEQNYNKDVSKMCDLCIKEQIEKYGSQVIPCTGLNRARHVAGEIAFRTLYPEGITQEEERVLDTLYDPLIYMEEYLDLGLPAEDKGLQTRWYQALISACSAQSKVVRVGRRCLPGYERITTSGGQEVPIRNISIGQSVVSYNEGSKRFNRVIDKWSNGYKSIFRIFLKDSKILDCTSNHPFLVRKGGKEEWMSIEGGLKEGDEVVVLDEEESFITTIIEDIVQIGEEETFDITVEKDHNFIANDIVTHNSGKTYMMAMMMVQEMITQDNYGVLLVSPYAVQTAEVIKTFKDLCERLPENPILSSKASPVHEIQFKNGSVLMGFTAATNANSIRGQEADRIVLDECLKGDTLITMADGSEKKIQDIQVGDYVLSENSGSFTAELVLNHKQTGVKDVYRYEMADGFYLDATDNHPVFSSEGVVEIDKAKDIRISSVKDIYTPINSKTYLGKFPVYNMTINRSHNFIANGYLTHNCDDIPEAAIVSIMAIRMTNPNVKVWRSGTPKGEVNLYRAEQDPQNKCFHYPSYVIPFYDDAMDASMRSEMGDGVGYIQEILALCGVASNTVFQSMFINRALHKPIKVTSLEVLSDRSRYKVFIGVDWNKENVGTRIIVLAYDKIVPQFHIIEKERIGIEGITQHAAVEAIIRINRKYNCDHVFADLGYGDTQISNLKVFALSQVGKVPPGHPDLKLMDVVAVDFNSYTTLTDPVTGEEIKRPTKQLAVKSMVEVFERDYITLDKEEDKDIVAQFKNYVEKSRNKGRIVYGYISKKIGDHDIDAIIIGIFGMRQIYSTLFNSSSNEALVSYVNTEERGETSINSEKYEAYGLGPSFGRARKGSATVINRLFSATNEHNPYKRNTRRKGRSNF